MAESISASAAPAHASIRERVAREATSTAYSVASKLCCTGSGLLAAVCASTDAWHAATFSATGACAAKQWESGSILWVNASRTHLHGPLNGSNT